MNCLYCPKFAERKNMCAAHYQRWRRHGDPAQARKPGKAFRPRCYIGRCKNTAEYRGRCARHIDYPLPTSCSTQHCKNTPFVHSLCKNCYDRAYKTGTPMRQRRKNKSGFIDPRGYIMFNRGGRKGKKIGLHRILMEAQLGRKLKSTEVVHHINEDPTDNRPQNLIVMTRGEHTRLHTSKVKNGKRPCNTCKLTKSIKQFYKKGKGFSAHCRYCYQKRIHRRTVTAY